MAFLTICKVPSDKEGYTVEDRFDQKYKQLLSTFKLGPSSKDTTITIKEGAEEPKQEEPKPAETQQSEQPSQAEQPSSGGGDQASSETASTNDSFIRRHYSIVEAYSKLHVFNEDDPAPAPQSSDASSSSGDNSNSDSSSQQSSVDSNPTPAQQQTQTSDDQNKQKNPEDPKEATNDEHTTLRVKVALQNEGYSIWTIKLDSSVNADKVIAALKSGSFSAAYALAAKQSGPASFIISKLETAVSNNNEATVHAPFIGRCRYAMDSGTGKDSSEDNTVCIAVAPIDGRTSKPSEKIVLKVLYNVINMSSLTDGKVKKADDKVDDKEKDKENDRGSWGKDRDGEANALSKWLNDKFKCDGDSESFNNFLKLRAFVKEQIGKKNLEFDPKNSESIESYMKVSEVKKAIIAY